MRDERDSQIGESLCVWERDGREMGERWERDGQMGGGDEIANRNRDRKKTSLLKVSKVSCLSLTP